jgi:SAM-dependent methyltransferase
MKIIGKLKKACYKLTQSKHSNELLYWKSCYTKENNHLNNDFYAKLMLSMADEKDDAFLIDKVVADFGCGPRGSLVWAKSAKIRLGIDVLASRYIECFSSEHLSHDMIYVTSTETSIPIPTALCDVVFSVNSLDHVQNLRPMCEEIRRILKPGGEIIGSFNLNHPGNRAEPQTLSESILKETLFKDYEIIHWWISASGPTNDKYQPLYSRQLKPAGRGEAYLWARARKPLA